MSFGPYKSLLFIVTPNYYNTTSELKTSNSCDIKLLPIQYLYSFVL